MRQMGWSRRRYWKNGGERGADSVNFEGSYRVKNVGCICVGSKWKRNRIAQQLVDSSWMTTTGCGFLLYSRVALV